jgi:nitrate reductase NapAB chaperone NapD
MPVFSYIAYPTPGAKNDLLDSLSQFEECDAIPAQGKEIILLVTDTPDEESEKRLQRKLTKIKSLQSLSMTFGHVDDNTTP